jgi:hypothetical protein
MRKLLLSFCLCFFTGVVVKAQSFCNPNGNLIIYSNYDGGVLTINVDVNIPNLKIGVSSYEATHVIVTGTYASNVTDVVYAGYNSGSDNCQTGTTTTSITSTGSNNVVNVMPPVTLSNVYGNTYMSYSYACDNTVSNPGGNTPDQTEHYFLTQFPGSTVRYHQTGYNCWTNMAVSAGGNCCGSVTALTVQATATAQTCNNSCNAVATASAIGGTGPYTYQWTGGPATAGWSGLCAGTYTVTVTDAAMATDTQTVVIANPLVQSSTITQTACMSYTFNSVNYTSSGTYYDTLTGTGGCDSFITLNLTIGQGVNVNTSLTSGTLISAQGNATYQWVKCPNYTTVAGATAQSYTPTQSGSYAVIVTYQGCTDTSTCTNVIPTSVYSIATTQEYNVYPNPAHNEVYVESARASGAYKITDQLGRVVLQGTISGNKTSISLNGLSAGLYFLSVNDTAPVKLFKQ